jgi:O-antigen/teichoic acid export membrane protein
MRGLRLARGMAWNLVGLVLPVGAALFAIPALVRHLGPDRFGVLSLAWVLVGYLTLFDLGIGPAVTRRLSALRAEGRESETHGWFWTGIGLTFALGTAGAVVLALAAPWLSHDVLRVPAALQGETLGILFVLAVSLPFVTMSAAAAGALAAYQRFGALNAVRLPLGVLTFVAPLAVTPWTSSLVAVGAVLVIVRIGGALAYLGLCARFLPGAGAGPRWRRDAVGSLLGFGGWMTVSAIAGPLMVYLDRFLIGAMLSLAMVAFYTTPYDMTNRILALPQAIVGVLFPVMAGDFVLDPARVRRLYDWGIRMVAALVFPLTFVLVLFAPEGMRWWLGGDFARYGAPVLRWIAAGVFLNALAQIALALVQASGRPRWSATLHLIELPLYLALLVWLVRTHGIEGAAIAWLIRVAFDTAAMFAFAARRVQGGDRIALKTLGLSLLALGAMAAGAGIPGLSGRGAYGALVLALAAMAAYRFVFVPGRTLWESLVFARKAAAA